MPSGVHQGLAVWDYLVVVLYGAWMVGIGLYYSGRQTNLKEYFLGGRSMNWLIVGISTMATLISTITYLTFPGEIIKNGFGVMWAQASVFFAFFIIGYLIIPRIMAHDIVSGYQLLERQFGTGIRRAAAFLFVMTRVAWVGLIVFTCSRALSAMTGWDLNALLIITGLVTTLYTVMGGIRAVIITDVAQAVILFVGAVSVVVFAMLSAHSFTAWWPNLHDPVVKQGLNWQPVPLWPGSLSTRITIVGVAFYYFLWWVMVATSDQLAIQRYLSTRNASTARRSFLTNGICNAMVGVTLGLIGAGLLGYFLNNVHAVPALKDVLPNTTRPEVLADLTAKMSALSPLQQKIFVLTQGADNVFPWFIAHILPAGISGLLLAALFSAAMSSVSSGINSITTVLMVDFESVFANLRDDRAKVARARAIGVVVGLITTCVSFLLVRVQGNFMDVAQKVNGFFIAPMAGLFIMAFFIKRTNKQGAWASIIVGFTVAAFVSYYKELMAWLCHKEAYISFTFILPFALGAGLLSGYLVSLFFPAPKMGPDVLLEKAESQPPTKMT